jgi:hypothetical protein
MARRTGLASIVTLSLFFAAPVFAQQSPEDAAQCERARQLFEQGTDAVDQGRLAEGRDLLRNAAALCPIVQVYFNLGYALRRSGFTTESIAIFRSLLGGERGALSPMQESSIREELAGAEREVATVRLSITPAGPATVELDGRVYGTMVEGQPFDVLADAGQHVVGASFDAWFGETRLELARGETRELMLELTEIDEGIPAWVWIGGAAAFAVGAAATIVLLILTQGPELVGPVGPVIQTLLDQS